MPRGICMSYRCKVLALSYFKTATTFETGRQHLSLLSLFSLGKATVPTFLSYDDPYTVGSEKKNWHQCGIDAETFRSAG